MSPIRITLIVIVIGLVIGVIGYWFFSNYEKVQKEIDTGFSGEARRNPLLAAQRFFEAYDVPVQAIEGLTQLPEPNVTLVLPTERLEMDENAAQRYWDWVEAGGHLIVSATHGYYYYAEDRDDPLLNLVGIHVVENKYLDQYGYYDQYAEDETETPDWEKLREYYDDDMVDVDWPREKEFFTVQMNNRARLEISEEAAADVTLDLSDEYGTYLLRLRHGKGYLTVLYHAGFMSNANIKTQDHAAFLWRVVQLDEIRPLWMVFRDTMPSLGAWLLRHAWTAVIAFVVFLVLWLWYASRRFGALLPEPPLARRRLLEHIEATGRFLWKQHHSQRLYKGVHQTLMRTIERRHPVWLSLSPLALQQRLAEVAALPPEQVKHALNFAQARDEHDFTKIIQTLEHIRKSL